MTDFVPLDGLPAPEITATVDTFDDSMFEIDNRRKQTRGILADLGYGRRQWNGRVILINQPCGVRQSATAFLNTPDESDECPECGAPWDTDHNRCTSNPEHCT